MAKKKVKKYKKDSEDLLKAIINLQLKPYNVCYEDVKEWEEKTPWYQVMTFKTSDDWRNWRNGVIEILTKKTTPKYTKEKAKKFFREIDLMWGLKYSFPIKEIMKDNE